MVYHRSSKDSSHGDTEPKNFFRNDGSFLEMFKKMQGKSAASSSSSDTTSHPCTNNSPTSSTSSLPYVKTEQTSNPIPVSDTTKSDSNEKSNTAESEGKLTLNNKFPIFGKRRGGRALPTGQVKKKVKTEKKEEVIEEPKNAWSQYLAEVKKYREAACEEEGKIRPLVK